MQGSPSIGAHPAAPVSYRIYCNPGIELELELDLEPGRAQDG